VLVDDGPRRYRPVADGLVASFPFLRVLHHRRNQGLTAALRTGFAAVRGEFILFPACRPGIGPETDIPLLLGKLEEGYDVVSRLAAGAQGGKIFASSIYNLASRVLFGLQLHDDEFDQRASVAM